MCASCVVAELAEEPERITVEMARTAKFIRAWYELPGNGTGGALHITTDDSNVEDSSLAFCRDRLASTGGFVGKEIGFAILDGLDAMSERQRSVVSWMRTWSRDYQIDRILDSDPDDEWMVVPDPEANGLVVVVRPAGDDRRIPQRVAG